MSLFGLQPGRLSTTNLIDYGYQPGAIPEQEVEVIVPRSRRYYRLSGVPADAEYAFTVAAIRHVDPDVAASGRITTTPRLAEQRSYQPSQVPNITANIWGRPAADVAASVALVSNITSDNVISRNEKPDLILEWGRVQAEYAALEAQAVAFQPGYGSPTARTNLTTAYNTLFNYLTALGGWNTLGTDTPINGPTFKIVWGNYYGAVALAETALANYASSTANWSAGVYNRPANLSGLAGTEGINNTLISIGSNGALAGAGTGQVTIAGLGYSGALNATLGANILPSFETQTNQYTLSAGTTEVVGTASDPVTKFARMTANNSSITTAYLPFTPGLRKLYLSFWIKKSAANQIAQDLTILDANGGYLSSLRINDFTDTGGAWVFRRLVFDLPQRAGRAAFGLINVGAFQTDVGGFNLSGTETEATEGAAWGSNLTGRPTNVASLSGTEGINNTLITIGANGALAGAGTGQVTIEGISPGLRADATQAKTFATDVQDSNKFSADEKKRYVHLVDGWLISVPATITTLNSLGLTTEATNLQNAWRVDVPNVTNGTGFYNYLVLNNYNTLTTSDTIRATFTTRANLFAQRLQEAANALDAKAATMATWGATISGRPANVAALTGTEGINNNLVTIGANGALGGAGSGQVSITGLGYLGDLNAGVTVQLYSSPAGKFTVRGNNTTGEAGTADWTGNVYSSDFYVGGAFVAAYLSKGMIGLSWNTTTPAGNSYTNINYAIQTYANGWSIYEDGNFRVSGAWDNAQRVSVVYDNHSVKYYIGVALVRSVVAGAGRSFHMSVTGGANDQAQNIQFGPYTSNNWDDMQGASRPENNATRNRYNDTPTDPGAVEEGYLWNDISGLRGVQKIRYNNSWRTMATEGAIWSSNLSSRPNNLAVLAGTEGVNNGSVSIGANGALAGAGGGQVNYDGLGTLRARHVVTAFGETTNIIPDGNLRDPIWWGLPAGVTQVDTGSEWTMPRNHRFTLDRDYDFSSAFFDLEVGATYQVRFRIWNNGAAVTSGGFQPMIHMPNVAWWSLMTGGSVTPGVHNAANGSITTQQDSFDVYRTFTVTSGNMRQIQFRFVSTMRSTGVLEMQVQIAKGGNMSAAHGRIKNPLVYNTQAVMGIPNTSNSSPTYSVGASNVTINFPAHVVNLTGANGPVTLSYGAASAVVAFNQYWIAYIDDPDQTGFASPSMGITTSPNQLLYPGRRQVSSGTAPAQGATNPPPPGGGGGGYDETCVSSEAWVAVKDRGDLLADGYRWVRAKDIRVGDELRALLNVNTLGWEAVVSNRLNPQPGVRLTSSSGRTLECSASTPVTQPDGSTIRAENALNAWIAVNDRDTLRWDVVTLVDDIGELLVSEIKASGATYLAGDKAGPGLFTHNPVTGSGPKP